VLKNPSNNNFNDVEEGYKREKKGNLRDI